jgi:hypothetical protein
MVTEVSSSRIVNGLSGLLAAAAFSISLLSAAPAGADPLLVVNVRAVGSTFGGSLDVSQIRLESVNDGLVSQRSVSGNAAGGSYSADSHARASYGALGVYSAANMSNVSQPPVQPEPPPYPIDSRVRQVAATTQNSWNDTLTVTSAVAPAGTLVDVRVTLEIDIASLSASPALDPNSDLINSAYGALWFTTQGSSVKGWCVSTGFRFYTDTSFCDGYEVLHVGENLISYDTKMIVGDNTWGALLMSEAAVITDNLLKANSGSGAVDAFNTAHTYFTVLTSGASLQSASGHDYSVPTQAVPEPGTLALIGLGFAGLAASRRRKQ